MDWKEIVAMVILVLRQAITYIGIKIWEMITVFQSKLMDFKHVCVPKVDVIFYHVIHFTFEIWTSNYMLREEIQYFLRLLSKVFELWWKFQNMMEENLSNISGTWACDFWLITFMLS